jgi:hypothetical protein
MLVTSTKNRTRLVVAGAFAVAAVAAPFAASVLDTTASSEDLAGPACLAWFGNKEDGRCLSYSNGYPIYAGTPSFGYGPNDGIMSGPNFSTGPMLPGAIIDTPVA